MGIDHSEYFGGTIEGVAKEKTGIIKSHATVVSAVQADEVATIVTAVARRASATPIWEGAQMSVISSEPVPGGRLMTLATAADTYPDLFLPMHGAFQVHNALLALAAVEAFLGRGVPCSLDASTVAAGFASASSPGRLEVAANAPLVVLDAAHNPHGVAALAGAAQEVLGDRATVGVIAVLADKDARGILEGVSALVDRVVVTRTSSDRALSVDALERLAIDALGAHRVQRAADVSLAIAKARDLAGPQGAVLVTGSITLVAQARHVLGMTLRGVGQAGDAASVPA